MDEDEGLAAESPEGVDESFEVGSEASPSPTVAVVVVVVSSLVIVSMDSLSLASGTRCGGEVGNVEEFSLSFESPSDMVLIWVLRLLLNKGRVG